ncbi:hypothetical protein [Bradyrhizobium glycinis]|uniref:hypothetical protein n=1 Tax=Bradyrhizobium glycinis TaxID=2751812 RepID=UPI001FEA4C33|nr:hypothetical protein [Bradyrhizobium glycinis]
MAKPSQIVLTPFFRPRDEDAEEQQMYVAGFVDEEDEPWGTLIPLGRRWSSKPLWGIRHSGFGATPTAASNRSLAMTGYMNTFSRKVN